MTVRSRHDRTVRVGGSYGTRASLTLANNAPLELSVFGVTDEVAARVLLGDTQIGVGKRRSSEENPAESAQSIVVSALASDIHRSLVPIELVVELGTAPVQHARVGADASITWREVARVTVHPERAHLACQLAAIAPLTMGGWALIETLSQLGLTSRGRLALDVLVMAASVVPMAHATRARARGVSQWKLARTLSAATVALALPAMLAEQPVDNRTDQTITVGGVSIPGGVSRWLPREFEAHRAALEGQRFIVTRQSQRYPCVAREDEQSARRPLTKQLEPWHIARGGYLRALDRGSVGVLPTGERSICDGRVSSESICCVLTGEGATDPSVGDIPIPTRQREVQRTMRLRWRPNGTPLDAEGLGNNTFTVFAWHELAMRGATRTLRELESHWVAAPAVRELALDGFAPDVERRVTLLLDDQQPLEVRCPVATASGHLLRATDPALHALIVDNTRYPLSTQQPTVVCASGGELKLVLSGGATDRTLRNPWALPFAARLVTIVEQQGDREVTLGRAQCPVDAGRHISVVALRTRGFDAIERIEHFPSRDIGGTLWDSPADQASARAFLCVASDRLAVLPGESASLLQRPMLETVRVAERGRTTLASGVLSRRRGYTLFRPIDPRSSETKCCYDASSGVSTLCRFLRNRREMSVESTVIVTECGVDTASSVDALGRYPTARDRAPVTRGRGSSSSGRRP
jgi:hypothetical protein